MVFGDANKQTNKQTNKHSRQYTQTNTQTNSSTRSACAFASRALAAAAVAPTPTASASSPGARGVPAIVLRLARGRLAVREDFGLREPPRLSIARLAMPSTQTRPMARPQQGTQRFTRHHRVTMVSSDVTREHRNGTRAAVAKCVGGAFRCCTRGTERARPRR